MNASMTTAALFGHPVIESCLANAGPGSNPLDTDAAKSDLQNGIESRFQHGLMELFAPGSAPLRCVLDFDRTKKAYGKVDILVNNAGVYAFAPVESVTSDEFSRTFSTNVLGLLLVTKTALPLFPETGGSIVNVSSVVSTMAPPTTSVCAGTKGAVDTITKTMAKEFGARKSRVNAVNTGLVITEGLHTAGMADNAFEDQMVAMAPLGRAGLPDDIALTVVFLASEDASWPTGVTILASGGAGI